VRLLAGAAATIFIVLAASWFAITSFFQRDIERRELGWTLALYLLLLWVILSLVAWVQVQLGLRSLSRMRKDIEALKSDAAERLSASYPTEMEPLASSINELADAREQELAAVRRRAADLAQGLKTPLAALSAGSRRARESGAANAAEGLDRAIATASAVVNAELARSRSETTRHAVRHVQTAARFVAERVVAVVERTDLGAEHVFEVELPESVFVPVAPEDLAELLSAVIENAARFARRHVKISGLTTDDVSSLVIEDDGPGLGPYHAAQVSSRHGRPDEAGPGAGGGLGLSTARELVEATRGQLTLGAATLGGLRVQIDWPAQRGA
jgi:signal transduction histidine kinase